VTLCEGSTVEQKEAFYKAIVVGLRERLSFRPEDVFVNAVD
jgi:4-oxalocrotonate tautomerase